MFLIIADNMHYFNPLENEIQQDKLVLFLMSETSIPHYIFHRRAVYAFFFYHSSWVHVHSAFLLMEAIFWRISLQWLTQNSSNFVFTKITVKLSLNGRHIHRKYKGKCLETQLTMNCTLKAVNGVWPDNNWLFVRSSWWNGDNWTVHVCLWGQEY